MRHRTLDNDMPIGKLTQIADYLPSPSELIHTESNVKITILLKKSSVIFFKKQAHRHHTKYQKMMREVLNQYATRHQTV